MHRYVPVFICLLLSVFVAAQPGTRKVLFVIADGIPADQVEKTDLTTLREIGKAGGYARIHVGGDRGTYTETPTISAVGYNSLLTGTWVNKHQVWDNDIRHPNYAYPTIFYFLKKDRPKSRIGIYSTWTANRKLLAGDSLAATGFLHVDFHADGYEEDTVQFPHDAEGNYIHKIDEQVAMDASASIREHGPDLSWVYLEYTDDMGHRYGDGPRFSEALSMLDKQLAGIWASVRYRQEKFGEDWLVLVTTDHGRDSHGGRNHGGQSDRERGTWLYTNAKGLNEYFYSGKASIVDILPTIARFMRLNIPKQYREELDGVPLTGTISMINPDARLNGHDIKISWTPMDKTGKVKVWLSTSNQAAEGGRDEYQLVGETSLDAGSFTLDISGRPANFYKILLEGPQNFLNRWVIIKQKK